MVLFCRGKEKESCRKKPDMREVISRPQKFSCAICRGSVRGSGKGGATGKRLEPDQTEKPWLQHFVYGGGVVLWLRRGGTTVTTNYTS